MLRAGKKRYVVRWSVVLILGLIPSNIRAQASQTTDIVIAFAELQHAALLYNQTSICKVPGLPSSCSPLLSNDNYIGLMEGVAKFNIELAKLPDAWKITSTSSIDEITSKLDNSGKLTLRYYLTLVKTIIKG